jgi:2,3-bisphosphoglycerate-dependent phosphoglycerate mutase
MSMHDDSTYPGRPSLMLFVRHGESARNVAKKHNRFFLDDESRKAVQGIPDWQVPLTEEGWRQARVTGLALRERYGTFDYVYHSGYRRTEETAEGILEAYPDAERASMHVRMNASIRERDNGYTYDMTTAEAEAAFPWLQPYWDTFGPWFSRPPGGESLADVATRAYTFLNTMFRDRVGARILVVTHGGTLRAFRFLLERWSFDRVSTELRTYHTPNCCVTAYHHNTRTGHLELRELNQVYGDWGAGSTRE